MRRNYGYGSYRGRTGFRTFLKVVIAILVVVLVLLVGGYFFLQQFAVVTDDGIRFDIPFFQAETPSPTPSPSIVVETPPAPTPTPTPTPEPEPAAPPIRAALLPREALYDGTAQAQAEAAGANAAVFDMKADDGSLGYVSELQAAKDYKTSDSNPALNAAIKALTGGDLYTVARVSCFRDDAAPYRNNALAIKTNSGYNWRDAGNVRWLSPASGDACKYVADVCVELARLGFDEILLDNAGYPTEGKLSYIKKGDAYDEHTLSAVISDFYAQVRKALAPYPDVKLSIVADGAALDGTDLLSGQTAESLAENAFRVWVSAPGDAETDYAASLERAGMEGAEDRVVVLADTPPEGKTSWAVGLR